jgi:regulator of protease activity HflC (stomatin/prohibitin superfamily)
MDSGTGAFISLAVMLLIVVALLGMWGCPQYAVYQQRLEGEAELAKANYSRQVAVVESEAKKNSAENLGQAEVIRAKYLAQANTIVGDSLRGREEYLRYLWIQGIDHVTGQIIYVPTEANLPVLEASRYMMPQPSRPARGR